MYNTRQIEHLWVLFLRKTCRVSGPRLDIETAFYATSHKNSAKYLPFAYRLVENACLPNAAVVFEQPLLLLSTGNNKRLVAHLSPIVHLNSCLH